MAKSDAERMREYRARNREHVNAMDRARRKINPQVRDPQKKHAWNAVSGAVRRGKLIRQPCEVCGYEPAQAHHDDYSKPLEIRWLCRTHHQEHHASM